MKTFKYIYWKGWLIVFFGLLALLLIINFVLQLPALFPVIGDENTWLPIHTGGVFTIAAAVIGWILQKQYKDKEVAKEHERQRIQDEINRLTCRYESLSKFVAENKSTLNFENKYRILLSQIDLSTESMQLIGTVSGYKQQIIDIQTNLELFYGTDNHSHEYTVYHMLIRSHVECYTKVLNAFIDYLTKIDSKVHTSLKKMDILMPVVGNTDKMKISVKKVEGVDMLQKQKDKFVLNLRQQKSRFEEINGLLDIFSSSLLKYESNKIEDQRNKLKSI